MKFLQGHVFRLNHQQTEDVSIQALAPDHRLHNLTLYPLLSQFSGFFGQCRHGFFNHVMEYPAVLLGIRAALGRDDRRQMVGTVKDIDNPVVGGFARTKSLNVYKADLFRLARFVALDVANPNTGIKLFAGKG